MTQRREFLRQASLITDHILPGVVRMPSGIFATSHAQGVGCGLMYAG